ncbi:hypothetical protein Moror_16374 [Moniliophthora roreri MCA 2997]|uniref:Uncharacterized protein n=1 Tax=Moniliophthora roreri (strain MCA 2997) TaxID=1381753 RepID=V2XDQ1_MONRO|nr:hypothetical protein Moror_16374 [Moniliophthora roreri MCA 2997]
MKILPTHRALLPPTHSITPTLARPHHRRKVKLNLRVSVPKTLTAEKKINGNSNRNQHLRVLEKVKASERNWFWVPS